MFAWPTISRGWVAGALLAVAGVTGAQAEVPVKTCAEDTRCNAIRSFFLRYKSPLAPHAWTFLVHAEQNNLDWRLLPSIAMVESSGGKAAPQHNIFGWNSGRAAFSSVDSGIAYVASRFARSPVYAGRTTIGILQKYNPARTVYPGKVIRFMKELSLDPVE